MKATGLVRGIDDLGRIMIPLDIRKKFNIQADDKFDIFLGEDNEIIFQKSNYSAKKQLEDALKIAYDTLDIDEPNQTCVFLKIIELQNLLKECDF